MRTPRRTPTAGTETPPPPAVRGRRAHAGPPADERLDPGGRYDPDETGAPTTGPPARAGRWHIRPRTVRAKIVCLLMVPVVSLLALWAYATVTTAQDIARIRQAQRVDASVRGPVADAVAALQAERVAAVRYATRPSVPRESELRTTAQRTGRAVDALRLGDRHTVADGADLPAGVAERLAGFVTGADRLSALRTSVLDRRTGWTEAYERYTSTIAAAFGVGARSPASRTPNAAPTRASCWSSPARARPSPRRTRSWPALAWQEPSTVSGCACSPAPSTPAAP